MTRFTFTTLLAIGLASVLALTLSGSARGWAVLGVWGVYLPICIWGTASIGLQFYCRAICRGRTGERRVALTFDDGPDPKSTPVLLEFLAREKIPAAFFCIGKNVDAHPELAARIAAEGHLLGNHSYRHPWWIGFLGAKKLTWEMEQTQQAIQRAAGITPVLMRSPMGLTNPHFGRALRHCGLTLVGWDVRSFDSTGDVRGAIHRILKQTREGSIILLHDGGVEPERMLEIVGTALVELRLRGLEFERLDRLIGGGS